MIASMKDDRRSDHFGSSGLDETERPPIPIAITIFTEYDKLIYSPRGKTN
jgi:hypothetical protein